MTTEGGATGDARTVVVTGAGGGIGRACAQRFAAEGAHVVVADLDLQAARLTAAAAESAGGTATALECDVTDPDSGRAAGTAALDATGRLDVLANVAGVGRLPPTGDIAEFPTNTSDALMSGGAYAIAGAIERQVKRLQARTGQTPMLLMGGGAAVKLAPITDLPFEMADTLIFDGLLALR